MGNSTSTELPKPSTGVLPTFTCQRLISDEQEKLKCNVCVKIHHRSPETGNTLQQRKRLIET